MVEALEVVVEGAAGERGIDLFREAPTDGAPGPGDGDDLALEVLERARTRAGKPAS